MKYLKKFQTNADYQAFKNSSDWITPNISVIKENDSGNDFIVVFEPFVNTTTRGSYTVNLNGQWEATTAIPNPDSTLYDGVYRSSSNYNVNSGVSTMYIDISGYSEFTLYIRSYAESNYDYVMVSQLDQTITGSTTYSDTTLVKAHTRGIQTSGTIISYYTEVKYTNIDGGSHRITILYRKDGSSHSFDDRGYVLILKNKESSSGGGNNEVTAPLITFTVNGTECQAEEGMTFYDWALSYYFDSSCNLSISVGGVLRNEIIDYNISAGDSHMIMYAGGTPVSPSINTDTIIQPISYMPDTSSFYD